MKEIICEKCKFSNDQNSSYCQGCGALLKHKGLKKIFKGFNFNTLAGLGQKGVSIAPLASMQMANTLNNSNSKLVKKSYSLEDGSWYCPYCGYKNKPVTYECNNCLKPKP